jgi:hypothetical protein
MLLGSNKQQHKEKAQNMNTEQKRLNTPKRTAGKNIDQEFVQKPGMGRHFLDHII